MIKREWVRSYFPFLAMMTASADEQLCKDSGFQLICYYDREKMQRIVLNKLKTDTSVYYNKIYRSPNLLPCLQIRNLAKEF